MPTIFCKKDAKIRQKHDGHTAAAEFTLSSQTESFLGENRSRPDKTNEAKIIDKSPVSC